MKRKLIFVAVAILLSVLVFPQIAVAPAGGTNLNKLFIRYQEEENIIHILIWDDAGRLGQPAHVRVNQRIIFGVEFVAPTIAELQEMIDDPIYRLDLSVDGGPYFSVKSGFRAPFIAATGSGPRWRWDQDNDGPGDGDSDGIGDWSGPTLFWRYFWPGLPLGMHTFEFRYSTDGGGSYLYDVITVVASWSARRLNRMFIRWQERENVIHILVPPFNEPGTPGQPPANVRIGQRIIFGFEWFDPDIVLIQAYVDNPDHLFELSVDGGTFFSVKSGYQDAFIAATGSGPRWSWDHDGDGPGDGDSDGIGDWSGPTLFWRYMWSGLTPGAHTFDFRISDDGGSTYWLTETITVLVS